ncbi:N-acetylmuramoyl-L-alanine amidase (plasmid) [Bacillus sp. N447-1]|uniref:S-layer homology domain-containing protein n=1 Tax=Bacillus sp. N447-1 TaxID=2789208 RepID=UPI001F60987E|nr:S-layer homology domain-containing protein [Bacillus sp. N447-1]UNT71655.1 N-acetylmuramoyl-L-alanine amidase [Bacillus sp. N447-1]
MKKSFYNVLAMSLALPVFAVPTSSFAEELQQKKQIEVQSIDEQALKSIEEHMKNEDGRGDNEGAAVEEPRGSEIGQDSPIIFSALRKGMIQDVPLIEWIVPKGNPNIRPGYWMKPKYITIHETDNTSMGAGAKNHAKYLYNQAIGATNRGASWHFTVDDKEIYQHLPLNENGWHAGDGTNGTGNRQSIAIEIAVNQDGNYEKAVDNARKLAAHLMKELNISLDNVKKHQHWSGKNCPRNIIQRGSWNDFLRGTKDYYYNGKNKDDITGGWYEQDIRELAAKGIMIGDGKGLYWPNRLVTRGEFATLISRALKLPTGTSSFKDLNEVHPSLIDGIKRAASAGIIKGRGNNIFAPNDMIKRDEAVMIIDRALQYKGVIGKLLKVPFSDQNQAYDKQALQRVYGLGIVKGNEHNRFVPKSTASRGESAAFINRMLHVTEKRNNEEIGTVTINGIGVNLREGPGTQYKVVRKLRGNEKHKVLKEQGGWLQLGDKQWLYYDPSYIRYDRNK